MRVVVAPDSYKGCLMAWDVARAISSGVKDACPPAEVVEIPVGDGGEGTARALAHAVPGARMCTATVKDPLGRPRQAEFALLSGTAAVVEMAAASGLGLLRLDERDPMAADTYGTGQLILAALDALSAAPGAGPSGGQPGGPPAGPPSGPPTGRPTLILAVGGSATVDGGMGMLAALGARFYGPDGAPLARHGGSELATVERVELDGLDPRLRDLDIVLASDVTNPLLGPEGAAAVFGPQKGATPAQVKALDAGLSRLRDVVKAQTGCEMEGFPGAGAAGGVGAAAVGILSARFRPGIDIALESTGFLERAAGADLIVTGEGHYDSQTLRGKAVAGVAAAAAGLGIPVCVLTGGIDAGAEWRLPGRCIVMCIADGAISPDESHRRATELLRAASRRAVALFAAGFGMRPAPVAGSRPGADGGRAR